MVSTTFMLVVALLTPVRDVRSEQRNDVGQPVISLLNASASATMSQVQVSLQSQEPSSGTGQVYRTSLEAKSNGSVTPLLTSAALIAAGVTAATPVAVLLPTTAPISHSGITLPLTNGSPLTPSSGSYSALVGIEVANHTTTPTHSPFTTSLGAEPTKLPFRVAANSTHVPSANTTAGFKTGPAGTSVQPFKGGVLGGRDGLWSSSVVLLVGIAVLLWL